MDISLHISPDGRALACPLCPQGIFLSRKYTLVFRSFGKSPVKTNCCAIISPPGEICGLAMRSLGAIQRKKSKPKDRVSNRPRPSIPVGAMIRMASSRARKALRGLADGTCPRSLRVADDGGPCFSTIQQNRSVWLSVSTALCTTPAPAVDPSARNGDQSRKPHRFPSVSQ